MERNKKLELNLTIEFGRLVLFTIFTNRKSSGVCSILCSGTWDRNYRITSIEGEKYRPVLFFILYRLSYK